MSLGSEFMPPLWEETMLYMPASLPGASIETMRQAIQDQDRILMSFPEVASVFAKAGRAETATDPAPLEMVETVVNLKPPEQWRPGMTHEQLDRRDGQGPEATSKSASATAGPCRSRAASTCSPPAFAPPSGSRSSGRT